MASTLQGAFVLVTRNASSAQTARKGISAGQSADQVAKAYKIPAKYIGYTTDDARVKGNFDRPK